MGNSPAGYHQAPKASNQMLSIKYTVISIWSCYWNHSIILIFSSIRTKHKQGVMLHININNRKTLFVFWFCGLQRTLLCKPMYWASQTAFDYTGYTNLRATPPSTPSKSRIFHWLRVQLPVKCMQHLLEKAKSDAAEHYRAMSDAILISVVMV